MAVPDTVKLKEFIDKLYPEAGATENSTYGVAVPTPLYVLLQAGAAEVPLVTIPVPTNPEEKAELVNIVLTDTAFAETVELDGPVIVGFKSEERGQEMVTWACDNKLPSRPLMDITKQRIKYFE